MREPTPVNECPIDGCTAGRRTGHLMCGPHWAIVPSEVRRRVWKTAGEIWESTEAFAEWQEAADVAITAVEEKLDSTQHTRSEREDG